VGIDDTSQLINLLLGESPPPAKKPVYTTLEKPVYTTLDTAFWYHTAAHARTLGLRRVPVASADVRSQNMDQILMTLKQAAQHLNVRTKRLRELIKDGHLKAATVHDGRRLFDRAALDGLRPRGLLPPAPIQPIAPTAPPLSREPPLSIPIVLDEQTDWGLPVEPFETWACRLTSPPTTKQYIARVRFRDDGVNWQIVANVDVAGRDLMSPGMWLPANRDGIFIVSIFAADFVGMTTPIGSRYFFDSRAWWTTPARQVTHPRRTFERPPAPTDKAELDARPSVD
jgi:excisionase family DNA binding protein